MSALNKNPFLIGFGAVMVLGVGALGYLTYSASNDNTQAREEYETAASELKRLQTAKPAPTADNRKQVDANLKSLQDKTNELQKTLALARYKLEDITPTAFQDKLRDSVAKIVAKAAEAKVTLPAVDKEQFYLGFLAYQRATPGPTVAPLLNRQLSAIEAVMNVILDTKNVTVEALERAELKEEHPKPAAPPLKGGRPAPEPEPPIVETQRFTLKLVTSNTNLQKIINDISGHKDQLYVIRHVTFQNQVPEPPPKAAPSTPTAPPAPGAPDQPQAPQPPSAPESTSGKLEYIYGKELVKATLVIDIANVKEPAPQKK